MPLTFTLTVPSSGSFEAIRSFAVLNPAVVGLNRTEIWQDGNVVSFRALVPERNIVAMSNGRAEIKA